MKKIIKLFTGIIVCVIAGSYTSYASSHREAPLISNDPLAVRGEIRRDLLGQFRSLPEGSVDVPEAHLQ